jgi:uncharacterized protein YqgC (DUF456 family)
MSGEEIIGLVLAWIVMLVGLAGSALPVLPGAPLVLAAVVGHRLWFGAHGVGNVVLALLVGLMLLSLLLDYAAILLGAKKLGATWRGMVGAVVGAVAGLFFGPVGILVGPFLGAVLFELAGGRKWREAGRAGGGAFLGFLVGVVGKVGCCTAMIVLFTVNVILRS